MSLSRAHNFPTKAATSFGNSFHLSLSLSHSFTCSLPHSIIFYLNLLSQSSFILHSLSYLIFYFNMAQRRSDRSTQGSGGQNAQRLKAFDTAAGPNRPGQKRPNSVLEGLPENPGAPVVKRGRLGPVASKTVFF
jgi:hypothetical protein